MPPNRCHHGKLGVLKLRTDLSDASIRNLGMGVPDLPLAWGDIAAIYWCSRCGAVRFSPSIFGGSLTKWMKPREASC